MDLEVVAYVPILRPLPRWPELNEWFEEITSELPRQDCFKTKICNVENVVVSVDFSTDASSWPEFAASWNKPPISIRPCHFLRFRTELRLESDRVEALSSESGYRGEEIAKLIAATDLAKTVCDIVVVANMAKPGALDTHSGLVFVNREQVSTDLPDFTGNLLYWAVEKAHKLGWPDLSTIGIRETWDWVTKIEGFAYGVPKGRSGRAFSAVSYLLRGNGTLDLIWALLGLEALFGQGNTGLKEQLSGKSAAFLGQPLEHKKAFGRAYDFRSRLIHGDIDIPLSYTPYDATDEFWNYLRDDSDASQISIAVLLATIQKMVKLDTRELKFSYTWE